MHWHCLVNRWTMITTKLELLEQSRRTFVSDTKTFFGFSAARNMFNVHSMDLNMCVVIGQHFEPMKYH